MKATSKQFAEMNGVDYAVANAMLRFLETKGIAKVVDHVRPEGQKGKASVVYELPESVTLTFAKDAVPA